MINSSELRATGFTFREVFPQELEAVARRRRTCGAARAYTARLKVWLPNGSSYQWIMTLSLC